MNPHKPRRLGVLPMFYVCPNLSSSLLPVPESSQSNVSMKYLKKECSACGHTVPYLGLLLLFPSLPPPRVLYMQNMSTLVLRVLLLGAWSDLFVAVTQASVALGCGM